MENDNPADADEQLDTAQAVRLYLFAEMLHSPAPSLQGRCIPDLVATSHETTDQGD